MKGTRWRTRKSKQKQEGPWMILRLLDLQVRVHDMHLDHNPSIVKSPPPPPLKKGEMYRSKSVIDQYLIRVPISSPEAVLLPRQVDHEFKDSRDS